MLCTPCYTPTTNFHNVFSGFFPFCFLHPPIFIFYVHKRKCSFLCTDRFFDGTHPGYHGICYDAISFAVTSYLYSTSTDILLGALDNVSCFFFFAKSDAYHLFFLVSSLHSAEPLRWLLSFFGRSRDLR